jgi:hypothetical protein
VQYPSVTSHTIGAKPEWIRHSHIVNIATKIVADTHQPPDPTAMKLPSPLDMDLFRNELPGNQTQQEYVTFHNKEKPMYASVHAQSLLTSI